MDYIEEKQNDAKKLIIFLHGYNTNKNDLFSLKDEIFSDKENTNYISLNAPIKCPRSDSGFEWFTMNEYDFPLKYAELTQQLKDDLRKSSTLLIDFIDKKVKEYNIKYKNVYLLGFSQGASLSLYTGVRIKEQLGGIVSCSGFLLDKMEYFQNTQFTKQNILFMFGLQDEVVLNECYQKSIEIFDKFKFNTIVKQYPNLGHCINYNEIIDINNFIYNW